MVESNGPRSAASRGSSASPLTGVFVRLSSKDLSNNGVDPDSLWSPTSPLEFRSLGLVDALTADAGSLLSRGGTSFLGSSIRPFLEPGLPKPAARDMDAASMGAVSSAPDDEVVAGRRADPEDYTCVIARRANPRTPHILGGGTLEVRGGPGGCRKVVFTVEPFAYYRVSPSAGVASGRCRCCMMRLPENRNIFIYKGEQAFCSNQCREGYIEEEEVAQDLMTRDHGSSTAFFLGEDW